MVDGAAAAPMLAPLQAPMSPNHHAPAPPRMNRLRHILWRICRFLLLLYAGLALTGWFIADRLIFQPQQPSYARLPGLLKFSADDGTALAGLYLPNPGARHTLVFLHGNAEDLGDCLPWLQAMHDIGFAVLALDYRGYGLSAGRATEANVYADTHALMAYARSQLGVKSENCVIVGRSLGGSPAVELGGLGQGGRARLDQCLQQRVPGVHPGQGAPV